MIARYSRKELTSIWSEENKYKIWLDVEIAAAQAMEKLGHIPRGVSSIVKKKSKINVFKFEGGIIEFVSFLDEKREKLNNKNGNLLFKKPILIEGKKDDVEIECALQWNAMYSEDVYPYTNNVYQKDGGTHLLGFRSALTRVVNKLSLIHI